MAKVSDLFPSKWLKTSDIEIEDEEGNLVNPTYTIERVEEGEFGPNKDLKLVIEFSETEKKFILNKTNLGTLVSLYGDETDDWVGKRVTLFTAPAVFEGKTVQSIRIRNRTSKSKAPAPAPRPKKAPVIPVAPVDEAAHEGLDEIPF